MVKTIQSLVLHSAVVFFVVVVVVCLFLLVEVVLFVVVVWGKVSFALLRMSARTVQTLAGREPIEA